MQSPNRQWLLALAVLVSACGSSTSPSPVEITFDFATGPQGWVAGFADYRAGEEAFMELDSGYRAIPAPIGPNRSGHFLSGNNHTDNLFMFLKRQVTGLRPSTTYRATFVVEFATDVPRGCGGVGGSPGESVFMKAGASGVEPLAVNDGTGMLRMNIDVGIQANRGQAAVLLGTIEGTVPCLSPPVWELKTLSSTDTVTVTSTPQGDVWVLAGTDSAFESTTSLYYTRFTARFEQ